MFRDGAFGYTDTPATTVEWDFPAPLGRQLAIAELTMAGLATGTTRPADTSNSDSGQSFVLQAVAERAGARRQCTVRGGDIYAITAPLVAEAAELVVQSAMRGVLTAPELSGSANLLPSLSGWLEPDEQ